MKTLSKLFIILLGIVFFPITIGLIIAFIIAHLIIYALALGSGTSYLFEEIKNDLENIKDNLENFITNWFD